MFLYSQTVFEHVSLAVSTIFKESLVYTLKQCEIIMPFVSLNIGRSQFEDE